MGGNNVLPLLVDQYVRLPRFLSANLADPLRDDPFLLQYANLLPTDVIPSQSTYQGNLLRHKNPGCRHSTVAPRPSRSPGDILGNNLFTRHRQPVYEAANIPVYGTTHYQSDHLTVTLHKFSVPLHRWERKKVRAEPI